MAARKSTSVNISEFNGKIPLFRKPDVIFLCVQALLNALEKHAGISQMEILLRGLLKFHSPTAFCSKILAGHKKKHREAANDVNSGVER